jgi:3-deoxy-D-manno-octulosonate 8-phosphate phosphatase (KDO 8-P phosphatase)
MGIFKKYDLSSEEVLYMGDDVPDFEAMQACGVRACPPNAMPEIFSNVDLITLAKGGEGAVREIIEKTLRIQDKWNSISIHQA